MDYDDDDFESRNPQLVGEGCTEFSPILQPYSLPKYDFGDSLREHLRFDNLVESEAFLGIESQEDNQWIEEFSQGGTQIEFASSGAASCPISRHTDVWSEATSLESVEMLLKSVGQEEMTAEQTIIDESEGRATLDTSPKQTSPHLKEDINIISSAEDVTDLGTTLPSSGKILNSSMGLKEDSGRFLQVQGSSHAFEGEASGLKNLSNVDSYDVVERCSHVVDGNDLKDGKLNDANQREGLCNEALNCGILEDSSTCKMQSDNVVTSTQAAGTRIEDSNTEQSTHQTIHSSDENEACIGKDNDGDVEFHFGRKDAHMDDQNMHEDTLNNRAYIMEKPLVVTLQIKSVGKTNNVGNSQLDTDCSSSMKGNSDLQTLERCIASPCPLIPGKGTIVEDAHTCPHYKENMHERSPVPLEGDCRVEAYAGETAICTSGIDTNIEMKLHSNMQIDDEQGTVPDRRQHPVECGIKIGSMVSVCKSEASLLSVKDSKYLKGKCEESSNSHMMEASSSKVVCTSGELENEMNINLEGVPDASFDSGNLNGDEDLLDTCKICEENVVPGQGDDAGDYEQGHGRVEDEVSVCPAPSSSTAGDRFVSDDSMMNTDCVSNDALDGCCISKKNAATSLESVEPKADEKTISAVEELALINNKEEVVSTMNVKAGLLILNEGSEVVKDIGPIMKSELDACHRTEVEKLSQAEIAEKSNSGNMSEPQEAVTDKASGEVFNGQEAQCVSCNSSVNEELDASHGTNVDSNKEELGQAELAEKSNSGNMSEPQEAVTDKASGELCNGLEAHHVSCNSSVDEELDACHDTGVYSNNEELGQAEIVEKISLGNMSEPLAVTDEASGKLFNGQAQHVSCNPPVNEDLVAAVALKSCEEAVEGIYEEALSKVLDKPTCSSPTIISCVDVCKQGTEIEGEDEGPLDQNVTLTDVTGGDTKKDRPVSQDLKDTVSKEQIDFSFDVRSLADVDNRYAEKGWQQSSKLTKIIEKASTVSGLGHGDSIKVQEISHMLPQSANLESKISGSKGTPERKTRRTPGKATGKDSAKKGNNVKVSTPMRQLEQVDKVSAVLLGPNLAWQLVQNEGMHHSGHVKQCNTNTANALKTPTSSLPDLNTSAALVTVFQPPFTGSQQVQLRAQIFVYGSLIQGTPPEEACMISAFGDGGRGIWEKAWRVSLERFQDQKCNSSNPETPLKSFSGMKSPDHANKQGLIQSNMICSSAGRANNKTTPSPVLTSTMPLSSPLWSIPTPGEAMQSRNIPRNTTMAPNQAPSPLHPYTSPSIRNFVGHSWVPQSPFAGPWMPASQVSPFDSNLRFPSLAITEAVKSTPLRESSGPPASCPQHLFPSPIFRREGMNSVYPVTSMMPDATTITASPVQDLSNSKSRKRKKSSPSEDLGRISFPLQAGTYPAAFGVHSPFSSPVVAAPTPMSKSTKEKAVIVATTTASSDQPKIRNNEVAQSHVFSDETLGNVSEAKLQAEYASTLADAAVNHSQVVWDELDKHKSSGLTGDREAKLASAAVAIAAAASVAKAAAAAAKVAAAAALQAKLMAEEAIFSCGRDTSCQNNVASLPNAVSILGDVTTASRLKGQDGMESSGSILIAAREAARVRVEAASAASVRAENLDAIVKAAELSAEAVTQAGKVVSMGNYLTLAELAESGPKGYWKVPSHFALNSKDSKTEEFSAHTPQISTELVEGERIEHKERQAISSKKLPSPRERSMVSVEDHMRLVDGSSALLTNEKGGDRGQKDSKASVIAEMVAGLPEPNIESTNTSIPVQREHEKTVTTMDGKIIKEGSLVEVLKDLDCSKTAWCLASVLSWKDREAFVCYTETSSDKGEGQLREWISLNAEGDSAPRIRFPHPMTSIHFEGSKKRCREAMVNYTWSVGDRVDACINDCWCEGVVTEKNKKDDTTLTVHFPAQGKTSVVRAWQLRPSVFWKDGQWIEWSNLSENGRPFHEGDTPREKRRKIGGSVIESKEKEGVSSTNIDVVESAATDGTLSLDLGTSEKIFNIGKHESSKPELLRTARSGLQKEGSKKVFGIPKPAKKRKFMEVSKHYVADKSTNKTSVGNNEVKLAKVPIPQESGSRGWRNTKIDFRDKQPVDPKLRAFKTGKTLGVSAPFDGIVMARRTNLKGSVSLNENASGKQSQASSGSFSKNEGPVGGHVVFSSLRVPSDISSKKVSASKSTFERLSKGKLAPPGGKLAKIQEDKVYNSNAGKLASDGSVEPRRSNRKMQPTSRMLEGLQTSLSISNHKSHNRNTPSSRGNNNG